MARKKIRKSYRKKVNKAMRRAQLLLFMLLIGIGFIVSMFFWMRPQISESEKRELTRFPTFSFSSLCSGAYFDQIDLWFSDTFPFRESMVAVQSRLQSLHGFGDSVYGLSSNVQDEVPDDAQVQSVEDVFEEIDEHLGDVINDNGESVQSLGSIVVIGDAAYELYSFNKRVADQYAAVVNLAAEKLPTTSTLYDILVPTAVDVTMPDAAREKVDSSSQADAMRYIFSSLSDNVHSVNVYNALRSHRTEYIYFRTDHHWTARGAYYAYEQLCRAMQTQARPLTDFTPYEFDNFLGSYYAQSKKNARLGSNPDTLYAYDPKCETTLTYTKNGKETEWKIITDVSTWNAASKYSAFIGGDNPYTYITNTSVSNDRACLIVKESFGNAFVPFVAADFSKTYVVDYRYWKGNLIQLAQEKGADTVVFINNMSATRSAPLVKDLLAIVQ